MPQPLGRKSPKKKLTALILALSLAIIGVSYVIFTHAAVAPTQETFEAGDTSKCTGGVNTTANTSFTATTVRAYEGSSSAHASYNGDGQNAYARCVITTTWVTGDEVWYGSAIYLPAGFKQQMQDQVDLMRWDNYSLNNTSQDWGGLVIQHGDLKARLKRFNVSGDYVDVTTPFDFPEGRWVWAEAHQKLSPSDGQALNELYIDGNLQSSSTTGNTYGRDITRIRYGLVAISAGTQTNPLELWVDRATIATSKIGPVTVTPPPNPTPPPPTPTPPPPTPTPPPPTGVCAPAQNLGNINCDTHVDIFDLSILLSNFGKTPAQSSNPAADLNGNNLIDIFDLSILLSHFGA